jgi:hypothetical protein
VVQKVSPAGITSGFAEHIRTAEREPMSDAELKYPKWEREFQEAVLELNREKLVEKIQDFETAIFVRLQELKFDSDHHSERQAIDDALATIRALKKDQLSHPGWR